MTVKVLKDTTITVKAGQVIEADDKYVADAVRMGFVVPYKEQKAKKAAGK